METLPRAADGANGIAEAADCLLNKPDRMLKSLLLAPVIRFLELSSTEGSDSQF